MKVVVISVDVELLWGFLHDCVSKKSISTKLIRVMEKSKAYIPRLINLFNHFNIPVTWGIVAKLLMNDVASVPYGQVLFVDGLMNMILENDICHEIALHSLSHRDFEVCNRKEALIEVRKGKKILEKMSGSTIKTFIFPKNHVKYLDILRSEGFIAYRKPTPSSLVVPRKRSLFYNGVSLVSQMLYSPLIVHPSYEFGLVGLPSSLLFERSRWFSPRSLLIFALKGIKKLIDSSSGVFHIYLHDYSLIDQSMFEAFAKLLKYIKKLQECGVINVATMSQLAEGILKDDASV